MSNAKRDEMILAVGTAAHEDWTKQYRATNGDKPRMKKTADPAFVSRGITEVDIASLPFGELPCEWQKENLAGAISAVDCVLDALALDVPLDAAFIESASDKQHADWLDRNGGFEWTPAELKVPYAELPEVEKEKDRFFVRAAIAASK